MTGHSRPGKMRGMVADEYSILLEPYRAVYIDIAHFVIAADPL